MATEGVHTDSFGSKQQAWSKVQAKRLNKGRKDAMKSIKRSVARFILSIPEVKEALCEITDSNVERLVSRYEEEIGNMAKDAVSDATKDAINEINFDSLVEDAVSDLDFGREVKKLVDMEVDNFYIKELVNVAIDKGMIEANIKSIVAKVLMDMEFVFSVENTTVRLGRK